MGVWLLKVKISIFWGKWFRNWIHFRQVRRVWLGNVFVWSQQLMWCSTCIDSTFCVFIIALFYYLVAIESFIIFTFPWHFHRFLWLFKTSLLIATLLMYTCNKRLKITERIPIKVLRQSRRLLFAHKLDTEGDASIDWAVLQFILLRLRINRGGDWLG